MGHKISTIDVDIPLLRVQIRELLNCTHMQQSVKDGIHHLLGAILDNAMEGLIPKKVIPEGQYCYEGKNRCVYWDLREDKPPQERGYCHYLNRGDWESEDLSLLWDQCKECGVNEYDN